MRHDGEPISAGRGDMGAVDRSALRSALLAAGLFTAVVLVNGLLFMLMLELVRAPAASG